MTIRRFYLAALLTFLLLGIASVTITFWALEDQQADALVINLAGRQRMLIQKMRLQVLGVQSEAGRLADREALRETAFTYFEPTLEALMAGGEAPRGETVVSLPPTRAPEILAQLEIVRATWEEMQPAINTVLETDQPGAAFAEAVATVERLAPRLVEQMDEAVQLYEAAAERKLTRVRAIQIGVLVTAVALLAGAYLIIERQVLRPISRLGAIAQQIGEGNLDTSISVTGVGEIESMAHNFDETRRKLATTQQELELWIEELDERVAAQTQEITARNAELRRLSRAIEQAAEMVVITDVRGNIEYVNPAFERVTGYSREEAIGQSTRPLKSGQQGKAFYRELWETILAGEVWEGVLINRKKSGELYHEEQTIAPVFDESGEVVNFVAIKRDITERKQIEAVVLESQKLADLGTLAAGVAHELNSPLQVITGMSESLLKRLGGGSQEVSPSSGLDLGRVRRRLETINRNAWRSAEIVRSLRTYAHASARQIEPNDLNDVVRDTLLLIEHQLQSWHNINVTTELAPELPTLDCDRNQITQALINLLTNARDAMPEGGEITIRTGRDPETHQLYLQVADTGSGIPQATLDKIFDPFFTTKSVGEGTGLGLSIVAGIVRAHGGEIDVDSTPGEGTSFTLSFPEQPPPAEQVSPPAVGGRFQ